LYDEVSDFDEEVGELGLFNPEKHVPLLALAVVDGGDDVADNKLVDFGHALFIEHLHDLGERHHGHAVLLALVVVS